MGVASKSETNGYSVLLFSPFPSLLPPFPSIPVPSFPLLSLLFFPNPVRGSKGAL